MKTITCNCCGEDIKITNNIPEDFITINKSWGFLSPFDGETHDIDLCTSCYKNFIDSFKIPPK